MPTDKELFKAALDAAVNSYSPYSRFRVGAALLCEDGRVVIGANVENRSFGLTICAERSALVSASVLAPVLRDDEELEAAVRRQLTNWFGPEVSSWRLLRIDRIPDALPFQPPGPFEPAVRRAAYERIGAS